LKNKAKVRIGIPVYNEEKNLLTILKSLKNQSYKNFEVIISDNLSTDNTKKIATEFCKKNKKFFYFEQKKKITSFENFNFVFRNCNTKYFFWNSGHDWRSKNFIKNCISFMEKDKNIVLSYSRTKIAKNNKFVECSNEIKNLNESEYIKFFKNFNYNYYIYGMIRTKILKKINLFQNFIGSDVVMVIKISKFGKIKYIKNAQTIFGNQDNNSWKNYYQKHLGISKYNLFYDLNFVYFKKILFALNSLNFSFLTYFRLSYIFFLKNIMNCFFYMKEIISYKIKKN